MEIRDLAEAVLFGDTLADKLIDAGRLTDEAPGPGMATPEAPGRPPELALNRWSEDERVSFTDVRDLEREEERGLVLHFFANHELLAAELMALVLLKFPEAPAKFRRGVAQTLKDEQEHVRLYLARMAHSGVEFGQIPVSDFFWRAIAPMPTPMDFVTRLSLTLEQANLDYAPHYQRLFTDLGDTDTAALMGRIYRDEIGHVKHGLNWFNTWRAPTQSEWTSFQQALGSPLSPSRAKGIGVFNRAGRLQAGLPASFIDELEVYSRAHSRRPNLYWFNPACDLEAGRSAGFEPRRSVHDLAHDLAMVPALLAAPDDIVVVPSRPGLPFLQRLKAAGLPVPELITWEPGVTPVPADLQARHLTELRPWGWSASCVATLTSCGLRLPDTAQPHWSTPHRQFYSKAWSATWLADIIDDLRAAEGAWLCPPDVIGTPCDDESRAAEVMASGFGGTDGEPGWDQAVVKAAFGAAGGQQMLVAPGTLPPHQQRWLQRALRDAGQVVVEPWLDRRLDLSAHYEADADGALRFVGMTRFLADGRGRFQGAFVHNMTAGVDADLRRFLYGEGRDGKRLTRLFGRIGEALQPYLPEGFRGPVGVDAFVYRDARDGALRLKPVVEVNPRHTMGRVAVALGRRVLAARTALWQIVRRKQIQAAGFADAAAWAHDLGQRMPVEMTADGRQISRGVVFTNEPETARAFVSLLIVAEDLAGVDAALPTAPAIGTGESA